MIAAFYEGHIFPWALRIAERAFRHQREEVLSQAVGKVLEVGIGTGISLPYYTRAVTELVGIEPSEALRMQCQNSLRHSTPACQRVTIVDGDAQALNFDTSSFDSIVAFLVFCTIPDPHTAARELFRVLKPGGKMFFFEHVSATTAHMPGEEKSLRSLAKWQQRMNPVWNKVGCGCNLTRDTRDVFLQQGFHFERCEAYRHPKILGLVSPVIQGVAVKPA